MEVLKHAVHILLNMSRYEETAPSVFVVPSGAVDVMVDLLQNNRETDEHIYITVAETLSLQSQYPQCLLILKKNKEAMKRMMNIQSLMERRLQLDTKSKRIQEKKSKLYPATMALKPLLQTLTQQS